MNGGNLIGMVAGRMPCGTSLIGSLFVRSLSYGVGVVDGML